MKYFLSILILSLGLDNLAFSQQDSSKKANLIVKTDIILPIAGLCTFNKDYYCSFTIEKCFNNNQSIQLSGLYYYNNKEKDDSQYEFGGFYNSKAFKIIPSYKYFLGKKKNYSSLYTGAYFKYVHLFEKDEIHSDVEPYFSYVEYIKNSFTVGPIFGFQKYLWKHFVFETFIGFGYSYDLPAHILKEVNVHSVRKINLTDARIGDKTDLRIGINIGYKF